MANTPNNGKKITFRISWFYLILIGALIWMLFGSNEPSPQKVEWAEVKEMWQNGDIKDVTFVRNEFLGEITVKPDKVENYVSRFENGIPPKSPHFVSVLDPPIFILTYFVLIVIGLMVLIKFNSPLI